MSKDSLIKGTLILTVAALVARFIGLFQKIPLKALLDDSGMGTYIIAFNLYVILFTIATAGLPSAVSKLVSERIELGKRAEADRIFRAAVGFALTSGLVMTVFLYLYAPAQARASEDLNAVGAIRAIAPSLLLFPLVAIIRGYFQGRRNMFPNGLSQIVEQIVRVTVAIGLAYWFIHVASRGTAWGAAGASFGGVAGTVGAIAVLLYYLVKLRRQDALEGILPTEPEKKEAAALRYRDIYKTLFIIAVPIVLYSATVPAINFVDSTIVKPLLSGQIGSDAAQEILGQLGARAQSLAGLPIVLAIAISQTIVPIVSSAYATRNMGEVSRQASKALQLAILSGLPLVLIIAAGARPINSLAFADAQGTELVVFLTVTSLFQIIMQTSGAILMGMGAMKPLVGHVMIGLVVKLAVSFTLAPYFGIYGIMSGTALCFIVMAWLNHRTLKKRVPGFRIFDRGKWTGLLCSTAIIGTAGAFVERIAHATITGIPYRGNFFVQSCIVGISVSVLYPILLGLTRVVTREDIKNYPASVQRMLGKGLRFVGVRL